MNILLILIAVIFIVCMVYGFSKGLVNTFLGALATIVALVLTNFFTPIVSTALIDYTTIDDYVEERVYTKIEEQVKEQTEKALAESGIPVDQINVTKEQVSKIMNETVSKTNQIKIINSLEYPEFIKNSLIENNYQEMYKKLSVTNIYSYVAKYVANVVINIIATILTFVIVRLLLVICTIAINAAMNNIPLLYGVDHVGGMVLGLVTALVITWIVLIIVPLAMGANGIDMIESSVILSFLQNKNVIANIITQSVG